MNDLSQRLAGCFSSAFPQLSAEEIQQASTETLAQWDSMALVLLTSLVEEEFKVQIAPADLDYFTSYAGILVYLQNKQTQ